MEAVGWSPEHICSRVFDGGVSLVINAPIDVLYAACELNEMAFNRAVASLKGDRLADLDDAIAVLTYRIGSQRKQTRFAGHAGCCSPSPCTFPVGR